MKCYKKETGLVREDFLLKGEQELFRRSGYSWRREQHAQSPEAGSKHRVGPNASAVCELGWGSGPAEQGSGAELSSAFYNLSMVCHPKSGRESSWLKQADGSQVYTFKWPL